MNKIRRNSLESHLAEALTFAPVVALLGPRQCGKTTLAKGLANSRRGHYFDLENDRDNQRLLNAQSALEGLRGLVVLDEIHHRPDLMPLLRVLADREPSPARFLILGSASPELTQKSSETLAGRIQFVDMAGFALPDVGVAMQDRLWLRGGFPKSFLARSEKESVVWRESFIRTFLQRDLPQLGLKIPAKVMQRFWSMAAHYHGQTWNSSEIASSLGFSPKTMQHYLDILSGAYVMRQLPPWFENVGKRIVKAPKAYVRDSGLFHALMRMDTRTSLFESPKLGASWEGFALEQILLSVGDREAYFWATHNQAELDLLLLRKGKRWGFEFKVSEKVSTTRSMRIVLNDLSLTHLWVVTPGRERYALDERIEVIGLAHLPEIVGLLNEPL